MLKQLGAVTFAVASIVALTGCTTVSTYDPPCVAGDTRSKCQVPVTTGSISLRWTINGQPAATTCATVNAANVRISLDGAPPAMEPCASGARVFASLPAGGHTVVADLLDAGGAVLNSFTSNPPIVVVVAGTALVDIAFNANASGGQTGGVRFTAWTVGGQPASTGCPANAQVKIESTAQPAAAVNQTYPCAQGTAQIDALPVGQYTFTPSLVNGATTTPAAGVSVTIMAGQVADVPAIDLSVGGSNPTLGVAVLGWTLNNVAGGANCPPDSTMNVAVTGPTVPSVAPSVACSAGTIRIADLAAGSYTFRLTLADPAHAGDTTATFEIPAVNVAAGVDTTVGPVNVACTFCGAT